MCRGTVWSPSPRHVHDMFLCVTLLPGLSGIEMYLYFLLLINCTSKYPTPDSFHHILRDCCITWYIYTWSGPGNHPVIHVTLSQFWSLQNLSPVLDITLEKMNPGDWCYLDRNNVLKIKLEFTIPSWFLSQLLACGPCVEDGSQQWGLGLMLNPSLGIGPHRSLLWFWCLLN